MGTVNVNFGPAGSGGLQTFGSRLRSENITSSGTAAQSTLIATQGDFVRIAPLDVGVYVRLGSNPTATAGDVYVAAGSSFVGATELNDKVSVIE